MTYSVTKSYPNSKGPKKSNPNSNPNSKKTKKTRKTNSASGRIETKQSKRKTAMKKNQSSKMKNRIKINLEKVLAKFFEKNIFFIAYMNHVLFYNNKGFDNDLTHEQVNHVKQFFNFKNEMELAPILPIISVIYNKYYSNDASADEIKRLFKIFKMDNTLENFMIFILKPNSNITEMDGGIPPKTRAMFWILLYTFVLILMTYVVNISKNSTVKDLLESGNYIKNIYKNSQQCDISVSRDNNHELLKRTIDHLGLNSKDVGIFQNFLKSIECFNERDFEGAVIDKIFESEDFSQINENNDNALVPLNNMVVTNDNTLVAMSNENTALVPANYKFDKIVKNQIVTYVRNGITNPQKIEQLLKEINENPDKPASEQTYYELIYDVISKNVNKESISAVLTGNTNYFIKNVDNTIDMIQDTIAKYHIASIKARRMTEKVMTKISRGTRSIVYLVMMLFAWYGYATLCVTKIIVNINNMRNLAIENRRDNLVIENRRDNLVIQN